MQKQKFSTRYLAVIAMFTAISFLMVLLSKVIPNVAGFLSYEPKDAVIVIAGFIFGPLACVLVAVLCAFIEMISISGTGIYGFIMNVFSSCAFTVPAAVIYKRYHTQKGAVCALGVGVLSMAAVMVIWNYIITPFYIHAPDQSVQETRQMVVGKLVPVFLPFNLVKGGINAGITLLIYKPIVQALRKAKLVEQSESGKKGRFSLGFTLFALAVLATFILLFLIMIGKI